MDIPQVMAPVCRILDPKTGKAEACYFQYRDVFAGVSSVSGQPLYENDIVCLEGHEETLYLIVRRGPKFHIVRFDEGKTLRKSKVMTVDMRLVLRGRWMRMAGKSYYHD